jgi:hypothetical protein
MNIDRLTPKLLLKTIRDLAAVRRPPGEILTLHLLHAADSAAGKRIKLELLLHEITWDTLKHLRQRQLIDVNTAEPMTFEATITAMRADIQAAEITPEIRAWSALYHRYFAPVCASSEQIGPAVGVSPRTYRRWIRDGVTRLVFDLQRRELEAQ